MANSQLIDHSSLSLIFSSTEIIDLESSPVAHQSTSTHRFQQLDKSSEIARQQSIARTQQKKSERPHAGSLALSSRPKLPQNSRSQLISQTFAVNIYAFYGTIYDIDLHLCHDWTPIR